MSRGGVALCSRTVVVLRSFLGLALFASALLGCDDDPLRGARPPRDAGVPDSGLGVVRGRAIYLRYCALCHGQSAEGYAADHANALGNPSFLSIASDEFLRESIAHGRPGTPMSAWGREAHGPLDDDMIGALVVYLRSLATLPPVDVSQVRIVGSVERGRALYTQSCVTCHGETGEGSDTAPGLSHPELQRVASDGFLRYTIEHGRPGTPMPAFGELSSQAIDDLVAYVRTLVHEPARPVVPSGGPPPGLEDLIIHPDGAAPEFSLRDERYVGADQVRDALEGGRRMVILDARATSDWAIGHIPGAAPFPFYDIEQMAGHLPHDGTWILAYCACPHAASGHVVDELRSRGFEHTAVIDEGIHYWTEHGYPVETGEAP